MLLQQSVPGPEATAGTAAYLQYAWRAINTALPESDRDFAGTLQTLIDGVGPQGELTDHSIYDLTVVHALFQCLPNRQLNIAPRMRDDQVTRRNNLFVELLEIDYPPDVTRIPGTSENLLEEVRRLNFAAGMQWLGLTSLALVERGDQVAKLVPTVGLRGAIGILRGNPEHEDDAQILESWRTISSRILEMTHSVRPQMDGAVTVFDSFRHRIEANATRGYRRPPHILAMMNQIYGEILDVVAEDRTRFVVSDS